ncbi:peptidoglycan/xylan/chitin deacetylase (PgdA/CDA1 family) [Paenibacillus phyllosphaerae]|uniref:Peptidoglycan/xylan/chitin deacetylase (PgdA/CDA1 family) n=1 Tax=Paenibacillus phyllosphaerae TaxID=274593 RepID=A0A7W5B2X8_9BACL|nr:polysaccharide deacetylase family protein [Paenibacillus phyllosphaerae]MBB3113252.1 peptidoglycan/xylan/chitin deacetylase (PgdA/CDA1 family) [Paenibacillus phyllosphaerae]
MNVAWKRIAAVAVVMLLLMGMMKLELTDGGGAMAHAHAQGTAAPDIEADNAVTKRPNAAITAAQAGIASSLVQAYGNVRTIPAAMPTAAETPADPNASAAPKIASTPNTSAVPEAKVQEAASSKLASNVPDKVVYLTFDDGPSKWTPEVLDLLAKYKVKATFFVLGQSAERAPEVVKRIVREGHGLGNHTYNHKYEELYHSFMGFWTQVKKTDDILTRLTGKQVTLLRAPGGTYTNFDAFYFQYLGEAGFRIMDWNVDSGDSKRSNVPAEEIIRMVKQTKLAKEVTLLLHDGAGHEQSVKALPAIIEYYKAKGYRFAVMNEETKPVTFRFGADKWHKAWTPSLHQQAEAAVTAFQREHGWMPLREWLVGKGTVAWDAKAHEAVVELADTTTFRLIPAGGQAVKVAGTPGESNGKLSFKITHNQFYVLKTA